MQRISAATYSSCLMSGPLKSGRENEERWRMPTIRRVPAGAPMDEGAGIDLFCKVGARVHGGDALYRVYANSETGLAFARDLADESSGYEVAP
jgi:hypothetical protein